MHSDERDLIVDAGSGSHLAEANQGSIKIDSPRQREMAQWVISTVLEFEPVAVMMSYGWGLWKRMNETWSRRAAMVCALTSRDRPSEKLKMPWTVLEPPCQPAGFGMRS